MKTLCWFRRDLRLHDHFALSQAINDGMEVYAVFIFDKIILDKLKNKNDLRLTFIMDSLKEMEEKLSAVGSSLIIRYGDPVEEITKVIDEYKIEALYFNHDYEPYAKKRDSQIEKILQAKKIEVKTFKDQVFYEKREILNGSGEIYKVFTPYKNKWLETFHAYEKVIPHYKCPLKKMVQLKNNNSILNFDWHKTIGFNQVECVLAGGSTAALKRLDDFKDVISHYKEARDIPALEQTSNLSAYIRMGNLSIREMIALSVEENNIGYQTWLSEIIWRDFYQMILDAFPRIENNCFRSEYDNINWLGDKKDFQIWCEGMTGYPIIDAAMRCLNSTGMMHNRLRMIVASFLTKTLLIDWRLGERYFAEKLLDYDLAANNGGWQWSASTGVDAQPYFRIFNPYNQSEKFDPEGIYIRIWCPELRGFSNKKIHSPHDSDMVDQAQADCFVGRDYPHPIVAYKAQKEKALQMFKAVK